MKQTCRYKSSHILRYKYAMEKPSIVHLGNVYAAVTLVRSEFHRCKDLQILHLWSSEIAQHSRQIIACMNTAFDVETMKSLDRGGASSMCALTFSFCCSSSSSLRSHESESNDLISESTRGGLDDSRRHAEVCLPSALY
jgi:hypothetical protein